MPPAAEYAFIIVCILSLDNSVLKVQEKSWTNLEVLCSFASVWLRHLYSVGKISYSLGKMSTQK